MSSLALIAFSPSVLAADLSYGTPPSAPVYTWTGLYIGGNLGYARGSAADPGVSSIDVPGTNFGRFFANGGNVLPNLTPKGIIGGGQIGYNWQIYNWVLGFVTDFQGVDARASGNGIAPLAGGPSNQVAESLSENLDFLGTARGRLGFAFNNILFYGTGGLAYGDVQSSLNATQTVVGFLPSSVAGTKSELRVGWSAGGGMDYMLTPNWIIGAEYLHYDLGRTSVTGTISLFPGASLTVSQFVRGDIFRGTVSYKF